MESEILDRTQVEIEPRKTHRQYETIIEAMKKGKVYMPRTDISINVRYAILRNLAKRGIKATWAKDKNTGRIIFFQVE